MFSLKVLQNKQLIDLYGIVEIIFHDKQFKHKIFPFKYTLANAIQILREVFIIDVYVQGIDVR